MGHCAAALDAGVGGGGRGLVLFGMERVPLCRDHADQRPSATGLGGADHAQGYRLYAGGAIHGGRASLLDLAGAFLLGDAALYYFGVDGGRGEGVVVIAQHCTEQRFAKTSRTQKDRILHRL